MLSEPPWWAEDEGAWPDIARDDPRFGRAGPGAAGPGALDGALSKVELEALKARFGVKPR